MPTPMRSRGAGVDTGDLRVEETGGESGDVRRRGRRESPPEDLGPGDPCDERSRPHDVPMPSARAGGSNLTQEVGASGGEQHSSRRWRQYGELAGNEHTRRCCRQHPLPSEPDVRLFDASGLSIEQRPCVARPGTAPPAHDTPDETRPPHGPWGRPGQYYGRAGDRDSSGAAPRALRPTTDLLCPPNRSAVGSRPSTPGGSRPTFARGDVSTPIRPITGRP